ncbi:cellulose-binding domain-containing protein [Actinocrinis sp.]|uniref:cellulose-binding domain-containing protein n=1 Tax=Actinocrinis sp. TaxID=1920516 RepID=UPI002D5B04CC|nr:cellulose-binding domain-containing protein [Actinocrinis sp.]HZP52780.1 cellulose-binding domain-containing protein [Actinocrinis sp.]
MVNLLRRPRRLRDAALAVATAAVAAGAVAVAPSVSAAAGPCSVAYQVNQWSGGFTANVTLTDTGSPVTSWTLSWTFTGNQQITSGWNAQITQTGTSVKAVNESYNGSIATGGTATFGFQGTFSGTNATPTDFALNGVSCAGGSSSSPSASASASASATPSASPSTSPSSSPSASRSASPSASPSGSSGGGSCPSAAVFCEGWESQTVGAAPSGRWSISTPNCSGSSTATITGAQAHGGVKSLEIDGVGTYCNHVFADDTTDMPLASPTWYVRFWFKHTAPLPTNHTTFLAMNDSADNNTDLRLGAQNGALMWNRQSDDATLPAQSPAGVAQSVVVPTGAWECLEFSVSKTTGQIYTWYNGTLVPGLTEDGVPTQDIDAQWLGGSGASWRPNLTDLKLGWENYSNGNDTLWFDDVVLSTSRIGC